MSEWREVLIPEVAFFQEGPGLRKWQWTDDGMKVINGTNILPNGEFNVDNTDRFISLDEFHKKYQHFAVEPEDIVVASSGSIGKVSRVRTRHLPLMMNTSVVRFHPLDESELDPDYLYAFLRSPLFGSQVSAMAIGTAQLNFGPSHIARMSMPLPPMTDQRKIGSMLRSIDHLIENNRRCIELLERMAQTIYREWFVHFRFPGHENATFVDSAIGPIPEGWRLVSVEQLVEVAKVTVDPSTLDPSTPAVGLEHIPRRHLTLDDWGVAEGLGSRKAVFVAGDILFGKIRPYFHKVSVAPFDGICSTDAIVIRPDDDYWGLAVLTIFGDDFVANATQTANGTKMPRADWKVIRQFQVVKPPMELGRLFTAATRDMLNAAQRLMLAGRELGAIRDLLLPKLVTGQIDVSLLDFDTVVESVA